MNYSCDVLEKLCMYNIYVRDDLNLIAYPSVWWYVKVDLLNGRLAILISY